MIKGAILANGHTLDLTRILPPVTADQWPLKCTEQDVFYGGLSSAVCRLVAER